MYYSELKMTEELLKHVFKELNVLYKIIKANLHVKPAVLYRRQKKRAKNHVTEEFRIMLSHLENYALPSPPYPAKGTKYSRSAFLGSLIHNQFYLHPILPHSVELWLISSTLTI